METRMFYIVLLFLKIMSLNVVTYKFGNNFGQVLYDYSGISNHGQNGESLIDDTTDTKPTNRGAYFSSQYKTFIKLPSNLMKTTPIVLGSTFSLVMWFVCLKESNYYLTYRGIDSSNFFYIQRDNSDNTFRSRIRSSDLDSGEGKAIASIFKMCI